VNETKPGQPTGPRLRLGGRLGAIDPAAIAKAEAALQSLSGNFAQWMDNELKKLDAGRALMRDEGVSPTTIGQFYMRAHDLKGLGATYGFPIVTRIAAMLCKLVDENASRTNPPLTLIDLHIAAINSAVKDNITTEEQPAGKTLIAQLEGATAAML
jgi:hypothetical protein